MSGNTIGRRVEVVLTNKSGGGVVAGDVVILDSTNNDAFTTTTSGAWPGFIGIAQETIANNASGRVLLSGYAALVNVNASVTRGNYAKTHTVAKQAVDAGASRVTGVFCVFLTGGTTPDAVLFGITDSGLGGTLTDHTHAATGSGANGGGASLAPTSLVLPGSLGTTTGQIDFDGATGYVAEVYDSQRERAISSVGWTPVAMPVAWSPTAAFATAVNLAANGGSMAIPIFVPSHMLLQDVRVANTDTASARTWGWDLYVNDLNNGNAGENTVRRVAACSADQSFTPSGVSVAALTAGSAPVYLAPGLYWLVIQNRHASNTFGVGTTAASTGISGNNYQTKTTTNPNGATLDLVAATWTKASAMPGVLLRGRVLGGTSTY